MAVVPLAARGEFLAGLLTGLTGLNEKMCANDNAEYKKKYTVIQQVGLSNTVDAARSKGNEAKNRYRNVLGTFAYASCVYFFRSRWNLVSLNRSPSL